jgi:WD40 repeat protein/serine/threonine protein kinase
MTEQDIFLAALQLDKEERPAYLDRVCAGAASLRRRLKVLLQAHAEAGSFLEHSPADSEVGTGPYRPEGAPAEGPGTVIGPYKLLQQIGEGGMGVVYMAEQEQPVRRRVALKVIKPGMDSKQVIARFEAERQALAMMDHLHIAKVLDAGTTPNGRPYFVMELVKGVPITRFCDREHLTLRERLELFVPVCQAIQHAHQKGVIHRDLKPSNILVTLYDGTPVPKVIDFGVAKALHQKLTERTMFTEFGAVVGTLEYMSPEQAELSGLDVDTRSDVYSLGVLLYELLTGTTPFEKKRLRQAALAEVMRIIHEEDPPKPSTRLSQSGESLAGIAAARKTEPAKLTRLVRGELDWIVMRALEKDRARRYGTANGLARDVQRYLADEAVEACPPSAGYRLRKYARRHRRLLATAASFGLLLILGSVVSTWQAVRATQEEQKARTAAEAEAEQRQRAEDNERQAKASEAQARRLWYAASLNLAQQAWESNNIPRLRALLAQTADYPGHGFEWYYCQRLCHLELHTLTVHRGPLPPIAWAADRQRLWTGIPVSWAADGQRLATGNLDGTVKVWEATSGRELRTLRGHSNAVRAVAWSPDSQRLATASLDGTAKVWEAASDRELFILQGHTSAVRSVSWSPDGQRLATASIDGTAKIWEAASGRELLTLKGHANAVNAVSWSPDGQRLATGSSDNTAKVWEAATGREPVSLKGHTGWVNAVSWSPDGQRLATGSFDGTAKVWEAATARELLSVRRHRGGVNAVSWSPDGQRLATASNDWTAKVWESATGQELLSLKGHAYWVWSVTWSPDGQRLATGSLDGTAKVWPAASSQELLTLKGSTGDAMSWSPDRQRLATGGADGTVKIWEAATGQELLNFKAHTGGVTSVSWSPDGQRLATASWETTAKVWEVAN